jgi:predicted SAM-dependent methyltransferase
LLTKMVKKIYYGQIGKWVRGSPTLTRLIMPFGAWLKPHLFRTSLPNTPNKSGQTRLHLGAGRIILPGFVNVDILPLQGISLILDLMASLSFGQGTVDEIYLCHVLEHFSAEKAKEELGEIARVLRHGAVLRICVSDLDMICHVYTEHLDWFTPPHNPWLGLIYGGQKDEFDFHRTGFNYRWLSYLLVQAGFESIERYEPVETAGIRDASFADEPFGVNISLNVRATRK